MTNDVVIFGGHAETVVFLRSYSPGMYASGAAAPRFNRGEIALLPPDERARVLAAGVAIPAASAPDPLPPYVEDKRDHTPTRVRLLKAYRPQGSSAQFARGEIVTVPAFLAEALIRIKYATDPARVPDEIAPPAALPSCIRRRATERARSFIASFTPEVL